MLHFWIKKPGLTAGTLVFALAAVTGIAFADSEGVYIGLDQDDDLHCDVYEDMIVQGMSVGDSIEIDIFWDNTGAEFGLLSLNCTVCVKDYTAVTLDEGYYSPTLPEAWTKTPVANSEDDPGIVKVDAWIAASYPLHKCWLFQATDFTLATPVGQGKHVYGTLAFRAARNGNLGLIIDGDPMHTGWFTSGFTSGGCTAGEPQDDTCQCPPPLSVSETASWGSIKTLFRDGSGTARVGR